MSKQCVSFGGLGDFFMVFLKVKKLLQDDKVDWLHYESNSIVPKLCFAVEEWLRDNIKDAMANDLVFGAGYCNIYQQRFHNGDWANRTALNTSISGKYDFPALDEGVLEPHLLLRGTLAHTKQHSDKEDIVIQVSGGAKSNRRWNFNILTVAKMLADKGNNVVLVGSDVDYINALSGVKNVVNMVGNPDIKQTLDVLATSKIYIGCSGFFTYLACSLDIKNIHFEESPSHNKHYIHPEWEKCRYPARNGAMREVVAGLRHYGIQI